MPRKPSKTIDEQIYEAKLAIVKAREDYMTAVYFETMPKVDPLYKYCYQTSNLNIPGYQHSIDAWLRAVIKHMNLRRPGHGGQITNSFLVETTDFESEEQRNIWIDYVIREIKKRSKIIKKKK